VAFHCSQAGSQANLLYIVCFRISSWMSANLLTLNSSKTEFLIIGLKQQLSKIDNSSLNTTRSARNLGYIACFWAIYSEVLRMVIQLR